jgi:hypothetical protein
LLIEIQALALVDVVQFFAIVTAVFHQVLPSLTVHAYEAVGLLRQPVLSMAQQQFIPALLEPSRIPSLWPSRAFTQINICVCPWPLRASTQNSYVLQLNVPFRVLPWFLTLKWYLHSPYTHPRRRSSTCGLHKSSMTPPSAAELT